MRSIILAAAGLALAACELPELPAFQASAGPAPPVSETVIGPATDGIFEAFRRYPLVGLSIAHVSAQGGEFYSALVRDPRFAREVGNVVVEFGGARHQAIMDRYTNGEAVPYLELRKVWTDVVGWNPPTTGNTSYVNFFAEVRAVNRNLPPDQRIRIWLGEPPVDWTKIETRKQYDRIVDDRDRYPAAFIVNDILGQKKKALVIYGGAHFFTLGAMVDRKRPGSFYFIDQESRGKSCDMLLGLAGKLWPTPALTAPAAGGSPDANLRTCAFDSHTRLGFGGDDGEDLSAHAAVLFLGPRNSLTYGAPLPDIYLDPAYRQEISRRMQVKGREPLGINSASFPLRRALYRDLDAPGWAEAMDAMFGRYDADRNGEVSEQEYRNVAR